MIVVIIYDKDSHDPRILSFAIPVIKFQNGLNQLISNSCVVERIELHCLMKSTLMIIEFCFHLIEDFIISEYFVRMFITFHNKTCGHIGEHIS